MADEAPPAPGLLSLPAPVLARVLRRLRPPGLLALSGTCRALHAPARDAFEDGLLRDGATFLRVDLVFLAGAPAGEGGDPAGDAPADSLLPVPALPGELLRLPYVLTARRLLPPPRPRVSLDFDIRRTRALLAPRLARLEALLAAAPLDDNLRRAVAVARAEHESLLFPLRAQWGGCRVELQWFWRGCPGPVAHLVADLPGSDPRRRPSAAASATAVTLSGTRLRAPSPSMGRCDPSPSPPPSVHSVASAPDLSRLKISFTEPQRISPELVLLDTADRLISHADTAPEPRTLRPPGSASPASTPPSSATPPPIIPTLSLSPSPPPPVETPPYPQHAPTFPSRPASPPRKQQHRKSPSWTLPFSSARRQAEREKEQERLDRLAALSELQKSGARVVPGSFEVVEHLGAAPPPGLDPAALADRANAERLAGPMSADRIAERALSEKLSRAGTPTSVGSFAADDDESALSTLWRKLSRRTASPTPSVDRARERERERDAGESVVRDAVVRLADGGDNTPFLKITYEVTPGTPGLTVQGVQGVVGIGFLAEVWERGRGPPGSVS